MKLITAPNDLLLRKSLPVTRFDTKLRDFMGKMYVNMVRWHGLGLSAPQVGVLKQALVVDTMRYEHGVKRFIINPRLISVSEEWYDTKEGCLSFPDRLIDANRPVSITVSFQDVRSVASTETFYGISAQCILHEICHLHGILLDKIDKSVVEYLLNSSEIVHEASRTSPRGENERS
jgi:peptide deformylase